MGGSVQGPNHAMLWKGQICPQMWIQLISEAKSEGKMPQEQAGTEHH